MIAVRAAGSIPARSARSTVTFVPQGPEADRGVEAEVAGVARSGARGPGVAGGGGSGAQARTRRTVGTEAAITGAPATVMATDVPAVFEPAAHPEFLPAELVELDAIVRALVDGDAAVSVWQAERAELMTAAAHIAGAVAGRGERTGRAIELPYRAIAAELGTALRASDRTVQRELSEAPRLVEHFPDTLTALRAARITGAHAEAILRGGAHLPDPEARAAFEALIVPIAERETPGRVRHLAPIIAERVHPRTFTERHTTAAACRGLRVVDLPDGMAALIATIPAVHAHAIRDRILQMAHSVTDARPTSRRDPRGVAGTGGTGGAGFGVNGLGAGGERATGNGAAEGADEHDVRDLRTIQQLCADVFADLALTASPTAHTGTTALGTINARVQVTIPVLALMGHTDTPGELAGIGPIDANTARELAGAATGWDRVLTHPITGAILTVDRYTPSRDLKRTLRTRDQHCRFPGCRWPAHRCDIDHTTDHARGGATRHDNLAHLCRRHHTLKHATAWSVSQKPGGILEWASPTGRTHPDIPTSTVTFSPDPNWKHATSGADGTVGRARTDARAGTDTDDAPPF